MAEAVSDVAHPPSGANGGASGVRHPTVKGSDTVSSPHANRAGPADGAVREAAFWVFLSVALALLTGAVLAKPLRSERAARQRLAFDRAVNQRLADGNARLAAEIQAAKSDPFYAERQVRIDLCRRRAGERVVRLDPSPSSADVAHPPSGVPFPAAEGGCPTGSWWERAAERLTETPRKRLASILTAGLLLVIAFVCFADQGPREQR